MCRGNIWSSYNEGYGYGASRHFQHYFSYIVGVSISAEHQSIPRKPPTCRE